MCQTSKSEFLKFLLYKSHTHTLFIRPASYNGSVLNFENTRLEAIQTTHMTLAAQNYNIADQIRSLLLYIMNEIRGLLYCGRYIYTKFILYDAII